MADQLRANKVTKEPNLQRKQGLALACFTAPALPCSADEGKVGSVCPSCVFSDHS